MGRPKSICTLAQLHPPNCHHRWPLIILTHPPRHLMVLRCHLAFPTRTYLDNLSKIWLRNLSKFQKKDHEMSILIHCFCFGLVQMHPFTTNSKFAGAFCICHSQQCTTMNNVYFMVNLSNYIAIIANYTFSKLKANSITLSVILCCSSY